MKIQFYGCSYSDGGGMDTKNTMIILETKNG